jgi:comEA protein
MRWRSLAFVIPLVLCVFVSPSVAKKKPPASPINLNTATSEQLQQVPGIGPSTADKILQMRKSYGAFKSVDDLLAVRGIGPKRLEKMRKYLIVAKAPAARPAVAAKNATAVPANAKKPPPVVKPAPVDEEPEEP